ncbi:MAG: S-adenosyl-l-methionine hydroxide adenosyltransferase family protein [Mycobacteriales bacterium]|nr:SAM-dependent chlorinase/fluorinase [Frankia sp.]
MPRGAAKTSTSHPWITFLSDYGLDDAFVGVCHGVLARIAPEARVIDVCHQIAPQDVAEGATTLAAAMEYLPVGVHLAIVDPGVGTRRRGVAVLTGSGSILVGPDNGVGSLAWPALGGVTSAHEITNTELFLKNPSKTFHGRDVFAPVTAHLANGVELAKVGGEIDPQSLIQIDLRDPVVDDDHVHGEVRSVDHFGNLSLNMRRSDLEAAGIQLGDTVELRVGGRALQVPFTVTFGQVPPGRIAVCEDSYRHITVAVNLGHASKTLRAHRGDPIVLSRVAREAPATDRKIGVLDPPPQPTTV